MVDVTADINFDLDSVKDFYPIDEDTLKMDGQLVAQLSLDGRPNPDQIENVLQQGTIELTNGFVSHKSLTDPIEDITFRAEARGNRLNISEASFINGENDLSLNGTVTNYLSDNPVLDLMVNGNAVASSLKNYYTLEPWVQELAGRADLAVNTAGPVNDIQNIALNGSLEVADIAARGDSLFLPVSDLSGRINVTPDVMSLNNFFMKFGSSDIALEGEMSNYLGLLEVHSATETMPSVTGNYRSNYLNIDEMIDWMRNRTRNRFPSNCPS
jgi:autotransporter translocation and assembly factor TamB